MSRTKTVGTGRTGFGKLAVILGTLAALGPFSIDTYLPAFPTMVGTLHAPPWQIQWSVGIFFVGLALGQVFYGPISDRLGRRVPLFAGLLLFIAGAVGCAMSTGGWELIGFRFIQALGGCAQMVISRAMVRDYFEAREAASFYSMIMLVSGLAPVVAPILGGWLLTHLGWPSIFWFMAIAASLAIAAVFFGLDESHPPERRRRDPIVKIMRTYGALMMDGRFMAYVLSGGVISGCLFAYISGSPFIYMEIYGVRAEHFGLFFGINALGLMAAGQANRYLLRRYNMLSVLRLVTAIVAAAAVLVGVQTATGWGGFPGLLIPLFICVSCFGFVMPMTTALAMAPHGSVAGYAAALLGTLQFFLSGLAGMAVGALNNGTALPMGGVIAFCGVTGFLLNRLAVPKAG